jgi:hypothetical protein
MKLLIMHPSEGFTNTTFNINPLMRNWTDVTQVVFSRSCEGTRFYCTENCARRDRNLLDLSLIFKY